MLERFPKLRVAFLEGNCSWLPWLMYRLDEYCELQGPMADIPLRKKPSEYFKEQCFISADVDEGLVVSVIDYMGDDNIVFSTDYPHIDSRLARGRRHLQGAPGPQAGVPGEDPLDQLRPAVRGGVRQTWFCQ